MHDKASMGFIVGLVLDALGEPWLIPSTLG